MVQCIPFNQAIVLWIVISIILFVVNMVIRKTLPKKLSKLILPIVNGIGGASGSIITLWAILSWSNLWKFSEPCEEYIPFPKINNLFS